MEKKEFEIDKQKIQYVAKEKGSRKTKQIYFIIFYTFRSTSAHTQILSAAFII